MNSKLILVLLIAYIARASALSCKTCSGQHAKLGTTKSVTGTLCDEASQTECAANENVCVTTKLFFKYTNTGGVKGEISVTNGNCGQKTDYESEKIDDLLCTKMGEALGKTGLTMTNNVCSVTTCETDNCNGGYVAKSSIFLMCCLTALLAVVY